MRKKMIQPTIWSKWKQLGIIKIMKIWNDPIDIFPLIKKKDANNHFLEMKIIRNHKNDKARPSPTRSDAVLVKHSWRLLKSLNNWNKKEKSKNVETFEVDNCDINELKNDIEKRGFAKKNDGEDGTRSSHLKSLRAASESDSLRRSYTHEQMRHIHWIFLVTECRASFKGRRTLSNDHAHVRFFLRR